ncbi:hypothetical protein QP775_09400 [Paenibacillus sp. UMB4589-SE434]|nr:hypothetical protein [Paenibacillus sp. UMB4589-SE434]
MYTVKVIHTAGVAADQITQQSLLESVAKGRKTNGQTLKDVRGTIRLCQSYPQPILTLINLSLTGNIKGFVSKQYNSNVTYSGPPEGSPYTTRNYYAALYYDTYSLLVKRNDTYDEFLGNVYQGRTTDISESIKINDVLKPINIEYYHDIKY